MSRSSVTLVAGSPDTPEPRISPSTSHRAPQRGRVAHPSVGMRVLIFQPQTPSAKEILRSRSKNLSWG
jgi:hypothetical protein